MYLLGMTDSDEYAFEEISKSQGPLNRKYNAYNTLIHMHIFGDIVKFRYLRQNKFFNWTWPR